MLSRPNRTHRRRAPRTKFSGIFSTYFSLRFAAFRQQFRQVIIRQGLWLSIPGIFYVFLLTHQGDFAIPWLPVLNGLTPLLTLPAYATVWLLVALPCLALIRDNTFTALYGALPLDRRQHRVTDFLLCAIASAPLVSLFYLLAVISFLSHGLVSSRWLGVITAMTAASWLLAASLLWITFEAQVLLAAHDYSPPLMKPKNRKPTHPGVFLRDIVLPEVKLSQAEVAERIQVSRNTISLLLNEKLRLSVEIAVKLGKLLNADAATLLRMQTEHDLWEVAHGDDDFAWIEPIHAAA